MKPIDTRIMDLLNAILHSPLSSIAIDALAHLRDIEDSPQNIRDELAPPPAAEGETQRQTAIRHLYILDSYIINTINREITVSKGSYESVQLINKHLISREMKEISKFNVAINSLNAGSDFVLNDDIISFDRIQKLYSFMEAWENCVIAARRIIDNEPDQGLAPDPEPDPDPEPEQGPEQGPE